MQIDIVGCEFQLTRLMRGVTVFLLLKRISKNAFQLTRLMRGVTRSSNCSSNSKSFQLTRLMRGVTSCNGIGYLPYTISTHTPHARRDSVYADFAPPSLSISTHTPHARRDSVYADFAPPSLSISTHTPHARRDLRVLDHIRFQVISTHTPHARRDRVLLHFL